MTFFNTFSITLKRSPLQPTPLETHQLLQQTYMKVSEAIQLVKDTRDQVIKAKGEILRRIAKLEAADGELTPEQVQAIKDLRDTVQSVDDIIPDETDVHEEEPPTEAPKPAEIPEETGGEGEGLESLTKAELLEKAEAAGVEGVSNSNTKAEIIEAINAKG